MEIVNIAGESIKVLKDSPRNMSIAVNSFYIVVERIIKFSRIKEKYKKEINYFLLVRF